MDDLRTRVPQLDGPFDAIFHDPFSPQKMPELWTADLFREYYCLLKSQNGKLLTYCTAAAVRGGLLEAGFQVLKIKGFGTKTGGTMAITGSASPESVEQPASQYAVPLEAWEVEYLASRASIPYRDPGLTLDRETILEHREQEQASSPLPPGSQALKKKPKWNKS